MMSFVFAGYNLACLHSPKSIFHLDIMSVMSTKRRKEHQPLLILYKLPPVAEVPVSNASGDQPVQLRERYQPGATWTLVLIF